MATAPVTSTVTINAAFLQEIKEVNADLWRRLDQLDALCREQNGTASANHDLSDRFSELRDQLALHFALEEAYGYFDDPLHASPRICERAERLREEHRGLFEKIRVLAEFVEDLNCHGRLASHARQVSLRFAAFHEQLMAHEDHENDLILEAYEEDLGGGD